MSEPTHHFTPEELGQLQEKFSEIKQSINNALAVMMAHAEMSQRRPDYAKTLATTVLTKCPEMNSSVNELGQLPTKFSDIRHSIKNDLQVMSCYAEMSPRRPDYAEKLPGMLLTRGAKIVSSLEEFTQALNEKAGVKPAAAGEPK